MLHAIPERLPFDVLHGEIQPARRINWNGFDDARMIKQPTDFNFALKPFAEDRVAFKLFKWNFQRDECAGLQIGCLEHLGHAALTDRLEQDEPSIEGLSATLVDG